MTEFLHPGVFVEETNSQFHPIEGVATSGAALVGGLETMRSQPLLEARSALELERALEEVVEERTDGTRDERIATVSTDNFLIARSFFENGGKRLIVSSLNQPSGCVADRLIGSEAAQTGLYALDRDEGRGRFQILLVPGTRELDASEASRVIRAAADFCLERRVFLIADPPLELSSRGELEGWVESLALGNAARNVALYFPALLKTDVEPGGDPRPLAASGAIAGIYARTDETRGVWKAPAGREASLRGATGVTIELSRDDIDSLVTRRINPLRAVTSSEPVVWGARTLASSDSEWRYVPVRRTATFLEESLNQGLDWVVFEPNDEPLWTRVRSTVGAFLHRLFAAGAFQGNRPQEAYFVRVDRTTMSQNDLDAGRLNVVVGFAPLKPAEFVVLRLALRTKTDS
jgi:phage tail sheath protein FI